MLDNGVCDSPCNNADCGYDSGSCAGCALGCLSDNPCSKYCSLPDCGYNDCPVAVCGPGFVCQDGGVLAKAAAYYQLLQKDFTVPFDIVTCSAKHPGCTIGAIEGAAKQSTCANDCNNMECSMSLGYCFMVQGPPPGSPLSVPQGSSCTTDFCEICYGPNVDNCLACQPGYFQFYTSCVTTCPKYYITHPVETSLCVPDTDNSTVDNPAEIYVSNLHPGPYEGTYTNPFDTLATALAAAQQQYVIIYLLTGSHYIKPLSSTSSYYGIKSHVTVQDSLTSEDLMSSIGGVERIYTKITSFMCSDDPNPVPHQECVQDGDQAQLVYYNQITTIIPVFEVTAHLELDNVVLSGRYSVKSGCTITPCHYCPTITQDIYGDFYDQHSNEVFEPYPTTECDKFHNYDLFTVSGTLTFTDVIVSDFQQQFNSLIFSEKGQIILTNTVFSSIYLSTKGNTNAVITQTTCEDYNCGNFTYTGGTVTLLNNGYELTDTLKTKGFVYANGWNFANIVGVTFSYNLMTQGNNAGLFVFGNFRQVKFDGCTFNANFGPGGSLINIQAMNLLLAKTVDASKNLVDFNIDHLILQDCTFTYNSGTQDGALILIVHSKDLQNLLISGCTFTNNIAEGSGLIKVMYQGTLRDEFTSGKTGIVTTATSRVDGVVFPPRYFKVKNSTFRENFAKNQGIIMVTNWANVVFDTLTFETNGQTTSTTPVTAQTTTVALFIANTDSYVEATYSTTQSPCTSVVDISGTYSFTGTAVTAKTNYCSNGSGFISLTNMSKSVAFSGSVFTSNKGNVDGGSAITFIGLATLSLSLCTFTGNMNMMGTEGGTVSVNSMNADSVVTVTTCTFSGNSSGSGGGLAVSDGENVTVSSSVFTDNKSTNYEGGAIFYAPRTGATNPALTVTGCTFSGNQCATAGGAISLDNPNSAAKAVTFTVTGCTFLNNKSNMDASAIYIESAVLLSTNSLISTTTFTSNQATNRGTLYLSYSSGTLTLDSVTFTQNKSLIAACIYTVHTSSLLVLSKVSMLNNNSESQITLADSTITKTMQSTGISCTGNTGVCVKAEKVVWTDNASSYVGNTGETSGAVYATSSSVITLTDASLRTNNGRYGGAVHIAQTSSFTCVRCSFLSNTAGTHGGAGYIDQNSYLKLDSTTVTQNTAFQGSAFYFVSCQQFISLFTGCDINSNKASNTGTVMMLASALAVASSKMYQNTAPGDTPGISMTMSNLTVTDSVFHDQSGTNGSFLQTTTNGIITITNSQFYQGHTSVSGGAIFAITTTITITGSSFTTLTSPIGGAISAIVQCVVTLNSVTFSNTLATVSGGGVYGFQGTINVSGSSFSNFAFGAIIADKMDVMKISKSVFQSGSNSSGGALLLTRCLSLSISESTFSSNTAATTGGAIYLETNPDYPISNVYSLSNNTYRDNTALGAGAIYVNDVSVNIHQSYFYSNLATGTPATVASSDIPGNAGGILLDCLDFTTCAYNVTDSYFSGNTAIANGGGIYWRKIMPNMTGTTFGTNSAKYAPNVASYPVALRGISSNGTLETYTSTRMLTATAASMDGVAPGQAVTMSLLLALTDHLGNIVKTDDSSPGELKTTGTGVELSGTTKVTAIGGVFNFSSFTVSATPNSTVSISVASTAINPELKTVSKDNATYYSEVAVSVGLRSCVIGESEVKTTCVVCDSGKYSLDPKGNCNSCPSAATCYGNYTMVPNPGYWRSNYLTDVFWACPYSAACIGSPDGYPLSYTGYCATGYTGNKCQSCEGGYSRSGTNKCGSCPSLAVNSARLFGIMLAVVVVIVVMVKTSLNSVYRPKAIHSIYIKIFMNYLQLVMLTASFNLEWPDLVLEIFSYQEEAGTVTDQVFSVDCYIASNGKADSKVFYTKLVVFVIIPVILLAVAFAFWMFYAVYRHNYTFLKNEFVGTFVILFFLVHPNIIKALFSAFSCEEIDPGEYWLVNDLAIQCFNSDHIFYSLTIALPGIVVWGIGTPAVCLAYIWKNRLLLGKLQMKLRFGFVYNGYELDRFYWEFVILYRKIAIICCSVFLSTISIPIQALTVLLVLVVFLYMQSVHEPYFSPELNLMELRSIMVATVTIYCGLFYLTGDLSEEAKVFFFALIVISNAYFLVLWIRCMMDVGLSLLTRTVPWVKKIRMLPELDGLEINTAVNERYINPFVYKMGRRDMFTFIRPMDEETTLKRQTTIGNDDRDAKLRQVSAIDMKTLYITHMGHVLRQDVLDSDFTVTPRSPPQEEEKEAPPLLELTAKPDLRDPDQDSTPSEE